MPDATTDALEQPSPLGDRTITMLSPEEALRGIYANNTSFRMSVWDIVLDFGMIESADEQSIVIRNAVRVIMSPQHARVLAKLLADNLAEYERNFGSIPIAPEIEAGRVEPGV